MNFTVEQKFSISIIMPAYNSEKYIKESIVSILNQTLKDWELIIIDDNSSDRTIEIIKSFSESDPRILFFENKQNKGVSYSRNRGIALASNEWIAFLDSDDMWIETKLEKQMNCFITTGAEFMYTGSSYINEEGAFYTGIFEVPQIINYKKLRNHNVISCSSVLMKKKFFKDVKMEKDDMHEDYAVWLRVLKNNNIIAYGVNEPLLIYRISRNSKSGRKIKSIKMTYKVFRFIGINPVGAVFFMGRHLWGSIKKYRKLTMNS